MTNREKYLDEILAASPWGLFGDSLRPCGLRGCNDCTLDDSTGSDCTVARLKWLRAKADAEPKVDWNKVPVDTPVWVRDRDGNTWRPRYFARYENGLIYTWANGATSWSSDGIGTYWNQAKLAEGDDNGNNRGNEA